VRDAVSDVVNRQLAVAFQRIVWRDRNTDFIDSALGADPPPTALYLYVYSVLVGWVAASLASQLLIVAPAYLLTRFAGQDGNDIAVMALVFCTSFCLTGALDALWRYYFALAAKRRYEQNARVPDDDTRRLVRVARFPTATLLLQAVVAVALAFAA
jgi:hypothetical protein